MGVGLDILCRVTLTQDNKMRRSQIWLNGEEAGALLERIAVQDEC
jgi:hypothetical protein